MIKLFQTPFFKTLRANWAKSIRTYWVPMTASIVTTIVGIVMISLQGPGSYWIENAFLTGILATIIFGGVALLNQDRSGQSALHILGRYALGTIPLLYFVLLANSYTELTTGNGITFALLAASSVFFLLCSAELRRDSTTTTMWQFGVRSISIAVIASAVGVIGYIAASLAAVSIEHLFQISMEERTYATIAVIMFTFVVPTIVIAAIAHVRTASRNPAAAFSPMLLRLVQLVFTPILITYFFILYAYVLKIVFQWELPEESVVLPVLVYTIVGMCTYALVDPWRRAGTHALFRRLQLGILLSFFPLLVLFGIAIADRVRAYGMTEPRYLSALFGAWLFVISIAYIRNRNLSLRAIPLTLCCMFLIASLPGIGAVATTVRSQQSQLIAILQQEKIVVDGALVSAQSHLVPSEIGMRVNNLLYTLNSRNGITALAPEVGLPETSSAEAILNTIYAHTGWSQSLTGTTEEYVHTTGVTSITGYDELFEVTSWPSPSFFTTTTIRFSPDGGTLLVERKGKEAIRVPLTPFPSTTLTSYDAENQDLRVRVVPTFISAEKKEDGTIASFRQVQLRVLVDYKDQP